MKKLLLWLCLFFPFASAKQWHYVDYDASMATRSLANVKNRRDLKKSIGISSEELNVFFKDLYEKNSFKFVVSGNLLKIPKVIHQIWLGGAVPEAFKEYMQTWRDMHPDWEYYLWTDENVHEVDLYNQAYYDAAPGNYGVQSDLLKWELVYQFGGVYVDVDFECLQPLDEFHYAYDFYTGIQPLDTRCLQLGAALFAAAPGNPILKHCIETICDDWHHAETVVKTGPLHFTKSFYKMAGKEGALDVAMPAHYFYPLGSSEKELKREEWVKKGAYAVHHWANSWGSFMNRRPQFRVLSEKNSWIATDFTDAMDYKSNANLLDMHRVVGIPGVPVRDFLSVLEPIYTNNNLSRAHLQMQGAKIPKIMHHLCLGLMTEKKKENLDWSKKKHPDWEHMVWTDAKALQLEMENKELYHGAQNIDFKKQLLALELLNKIGGVVIDASAVTIRNLDVFHYCYDFYAGLLPLSCGVGSIGMRVIGAKNGHPIVKHCLQKLQKAELKSPCQLTCLEILNQGFVEEVRHKKTLDVVFPSTYFYPQTNVKKESFAMVRK